MGNFGEFIFGKNRKMIFFVLFAIILRLINLDQSFWLDEAITGTIARDLSMLQIFSEYLPLDNHPPLYLLIIHFIFQYLPNTEIVARVPSVLFGTVSVYLIFLLGKELLNKKAAYFGAALLASSPLAIYYSQENRMYALTTMLCLFLVLFFVKYIKTEKSKYLVGYFLAGTILIYSDYLPYFMFLVLNILALILKKFYKSWAVTQSFLILTFSLILPLFIKQFLLGKSLVGQSATLDKIIGIFDIKSVPITIEKFVLGRVPIPEDITIIIILVPVFLFLYLLFWGFWKLEKEKRLILSMWLGLPLFLSLILSFFIPVFNFFRFLFVLPAFYLIISWGICSLKPKLVNFVFALVLLINFTALGFYFFDKNLQREDWRGAVNFVNENFKKNDVVLFASSEPFAPYKWYGQEGILTKGAFGQFIGQDSDFAKLPAEINEYERIFLFTYLQDVTDYDRKLQAKILSNGFIKKASYPFIGVGAIDLYVKKNDIF